MLDWYSKRNGITGLAMGALLAVGSGLLLASARVSAAQQPVDLQQMAQRVAAQWRPPVSPEAGIGLARLLAGMDAAWYDTANGEDYQYIKHSIDAFITPDGSLRMVSDDALQEESLGEAILLLYKVTGDKHYYTAATSIRDRMLSLGSGSSQRLASRRSSARSRVRAVLVEGPFLADYASMFQQPQDFDRITKQFVAADTQLRNAKSTDAMSTELMAGYMSALVEALQHYPYDSPGRGALLAILKRTAAEAVRIQDRKTDLWTTNAGAQNEPTRQDATDNSVDCMFTYALAKAVRLGYLPARYQAHAVRAWRAIESQVSSPGDALMPGADMDEHRDAEGARLLAASEMQLAGLAARGAHQTVLVDAWFNSQKRADAAGEQELFHYKWTDYRSSGFSLLGHMFRSYGVATRRLAAAPTVSNLKGAQYYIIASPDNPAKNPQPHYMTVDDAKQVEQWVRRGGVLLLMENDPANADIPHLDLLSDAFGLHFNNRLIHAATEYDYAMGRINVDAGGPVFHHAHTLYMKDTCSLTLSDGATALLTYKGDIFMATAKYGKGTVYAVTDPWLYNEYTDGRKLPPQYDNFAAGMELVRWLLQQAPATS